MDEQEKRNWSRDEIAAMDNDWILLHLIFSYKEDLYGKDRSKWSDETCDLWNEATARMKETVVHDLDRKAFENELKQRIDDQASILKSSQHTYSYHYGIKSGLETALREFKRAIRAKEQKDAETERVQARKPVRGLQ